jgi:hypothetical protein
VNLAARRCARLADLPVGEEVVGPHNLLEVAAAARDATVVVAAWPGGTLPAVYTWTLPRR